MTFPVTLNPQLQRLPIEAQEAVQYDFDKRSKSVAVGIILAIFGLHYLYLGRVGMFFLFWLTGGGFLIWWLVDIFRIAGVINSLNEDTARSLMVQYKNLTV